MENKIEQFCGLKSREDMYPSKKFIVYLYSALNLSFVMVGSLVMYYKSHNFILLMFLSFFLFSDLIFVLWLIKGRQNFNQTNYFVFNGTITLWISFIWAFTAISNIFYRHLGFSLIYVFSIAVGIASVLCFFKLRLKIWKELKPKENMMLKETNTRIIGLFTTSFIFVITLFKNIINEHFLYKLAVGGMIILSFVFVTISINMFINCYIIKMYADKTGNGSIVLTN